METNKRLSFCSRMEQFENKQTSLRYGLKGLTITSSVRAETYDVGPPVAQRMLEEIARRGHFDLTIIDTGYPSKTENQTWTEKLVSNAMTYDVSADWWYKTADRLS